jgi:DNA-directed RNA polymerase alpha subunit
MNSYKARTLSRRLEVHLLRDQFSACHAILETEEAEHIAKSQNDNGENLAIVNIPGINLRAVNVLERRGWIYVSDLPLELTMEELMSIPQVGEETATMILNCLARLKGSTTS